MNRGRLAQNRDAPRRPLGVFKSRSEHPSRNRAISVPVRSPVRFAARQGVPGKPLPATPPSVDIAPPFVPLWSGANHAKATPRLVQPNAAVSGPRPNREAADILGQQGATCFNGPAQSKIDKIVRRQHMLGGQPQLLETKDLGSPGDFLTASPFAMLEQRRA
jgi:hypothetical protein